MKEIFNQIERSRLILTAINKTLEVIDSNHRAEKVDSNEVKDSINDLITIERELTAMLDKIGNH